MQVDFNKTELLYSFCGWFLEFGPYCLVLTDY